MSELLTSIGLGLGAGVNAYATLLVFGLLSRFRPGTFEGEMATFFASTPVLVGLGVLYTVEFLADKIPAVDHVWDAIHTFVRPVAGALVAWASAVEDLPQGMTIMATILAGGAALGAHTVKASLRGVSTVTTAGTANPVLSLVEDVFAFGNAVMAIFLPWLVLLFIGLALVAAMLFLRRSKNRAAI